jgi:hypothetical protein
LLQMFLSKGRPRTIAQQPFHIRAVDPSSHPSFWLRCGGAWCSIATDQTIRH